MSHKYSVGDLVVWIDEEAEWPIASKHIGVIIELWEPGADPIGQVWWPAEASPVVVCDVYENDPSIFPIADARRIYEETILNKDD